MSLCHWEQILQELTFFGDRELLKYLYDTVSSVLIIGEGSKVLSAVIASNSDNKIIKLWIFSHPLQD